MKASIEDIQGVIDLLTAFKGELVKVKEQPQPVTPPGIKFIVNTDGQVIGLCFNGDNQVLGYSQTGVFTVSPTSSYCSYPVECLPLTECKYEDLKFGDFFVYHPEPEETKHIRLKLPDNETGSIHNRQVDLLRDCNDHDTWKVGK